MHNELRLATSDLARFLQEKLPELSEDWWAKHVVDRLSFQQQRVIGEKNISSLRELDFAALLRVLDQNWYDLSGNCNLPLEARNWVKELQTVRNKWAHVDFINSGIQRSLDFSLVSMELEKSVFFQMKVARMIAIFRV
jgi:hypothetical protein